MAEARSPPLRLVVAASGVLPRKQRVAVFDGYSEVSVGRDIAPSASTPRLRLKEMAVSKYHAVIFHDGEHWSIVDVGSMHGTMLNDDRLSQPRTASTPRVLQHADELTLGSTKLLVHVHDDALPCDACALSGDNEIPLFDARERTRSRSSTTYTASSSDPKAAIAVLRRDLLSRHAGSPSTSSSTSYKDRAAFRRATAPEPPPLTPTSSAQVREPSTRVSARSQVPHYPERAVSTAPAPLSQSNIGHQLLLKQGWTPGTGLGLSEDARLEPVPVILLPERAGLGSSTEHQGPAGFARSLHSRP